MRGEEAVEVEQAGGERGRAQRDEGGGGGRGRGRERGQEAGEGARVVLEEPVRDALQAAEGGEAERRRKWEESRYQGSAVRRARGRR